MRYRAPLRHYYWFVHHLVLLVLWCALFLPNCISSGFSTWSDDLTTAQPEHAKALEARIDAHLSSKFEGYHRSDVLNDNFKIVALSHMAYGYMNLATAFPEQRERYAPRITEVLLRALDARTSPLKKHASEVDSFGDHNLYASHLNLILGIYRFITQDDTHDALHTRLSKHLRTQSLRDKDAHARSYPRPKHLAERADAYKWPADQSVTLLSLALYDRTRKKDLSKKPIKAWLAFMARDTQRDTSLGLPHSALDKKITYARHPRGCALSWTVLYMNQFSPEDAQELYTSYRAHYGREVLGFGGFREWPPEQDRGMDGDSGLIIMGVGMAATGLGLGPARMMKDSAQYSIIMRSATTFGLPTSLLSERRYVTAPLLGEAILFSGVTAHQWFEEDVVSTDYTESEPWATGNWILLLILSALIFYSISSVREQWRFIRR